MTLYNDNDPKAAAWLRELIACDYLPVGPVFERPIQALTYDDLAQYATFHAFAGIGGWPLALRLASWPDDAPVWTGSCPCQPFSVAGARAGERDKRHLWPEFKRLIALCRPPIVFGEQVAGKAGREWLARVRADLEELGYAVGASDLCAAGEGAPHIRQRLFWGAVRNGVALTQCDAGESRRLADRSTSGDATPSAGPLPEPGRPSDAGRLADNSGTCGLDNASSPRRDGTGQRTEGEARDDARLCGSESGCEPCGLAEPEHAIGRSQPQRNKHNRKDGRRAQADGEPGACGEVRFWDRFSTIHCLDNRTRRFEPESFPLAHGVPARVGRLRGYGNAIVPEVAATFIRTFVEASRDE